MRMANPNVVEHEILGQLKRAGLIIVSTGSDAEGFIPIDKFVIKTAALHYGTLVYLLNRDMSSPDPAEAGPIHWRNIIKRKEDITIRQFGWEDIADAVQTLSFKKDITDDADGTSSDERVIRLTEQGLASYNRKVYLKEAIADQRAQEAEEYTRQSAIYTKQLTASTVNTNKWVKRMAILGGFLTCVLAATGLFQYFKADEIKVKDWDLLLKKMDKPIVEDQKKDTAVKVDTSSIQRYDTLNTKKSDEKPYHRKVRS